MSAPLTGKVCVVTGASRGIGKGIALQLAEKGATVYITGRTLDPPNDSIGGSLRDTAREVEARGGNCIPIQCDHSNDTDVKKLFDQIARQQDGQLDVLVNNAYSAVTAIFSNLGTPFWEQPLSMWDDVNCVGLRNHYLCSIYAAKLMVPRKRGLIVNVSSVGGLRYLFNVPYGVGKEACDRMAADCGFELRKHNIAFISLWPGAVGTETVLHQVQGEVKKYEEGKPTKIAKGMQMNNPNKVRALFENGETTEFAGQCIASLACDPDVMKKSGKICMTSDLGCEYGLTDKEGHTPTDTCSVKAMLTNQGRTWLAAVTPRFVRIPKVLMALAGNKL